jgi:hypothetical protein
VVDPVHGSWPLILDHRCPPSPDCPINVGDSITAVRNAREW